MLSKPKVVWAAQSPTLLNLLARSSAWQILVADFGDAAGLMEMRYLQAPAWDGDAGQIDLVFVCSPLHVDHARKLLPNTRVVLVAHQGYSHKLPDCPEAVAIICFSNEIRDTIISDSYTRRERLRTQSVHAIIPSLTATPRWVWTGSRVWTMMNRPQHREAISVAGLNSVQPLVSHSILVFGQGQARGPLDGRAREGLLRASSCYFSALHPRAGFGLAEHEAMAAGCPVIGFLWGELAFRKRHSLGGPWRGFRAFGDIYNLAELVTEVASGSELARAVSLEQLDYIAENFSTAKMDDSVQAFMDAVV